MAFRAWRQSHCIALFAQQRAYAARPNRVFPVGKQKYIPSIGKYPQGFLAGSAHAGVKPANKTLDDVALVVSEQPCAAAALFTRNLFKAAPVILSQAILQNQTEGFRGVVVNSGNANAVTGTEGSKHALDMVQIAERCLAATSLEAETTASPDPTGSMLVMSTGVIGQKLPIEKIVAAIPKAHDTSGSSHQHWMGAAQAICTTDTFPKLISRTFKLPSDPSTEYSIAGMTKGAGMLHPNLGTLLTIVCTDVNIAQNSIKEILEAATDLSFNCISVDGDTSTNDTIALFANGAAAPASVEPLEVEKDASADVEAFSQILTEFLIDLAKLIVRDGEGATKFVTVRVQSANSIQAARRAAASVSQSSLVKTALYGRDANWGRILCAIGYAPGIVDNPTLSIQSDQRDQVEPSQTTVSFIRADGSGELMLLKRGEPQDADEARAKEILEMDDLEIFVRLSDDGTAVEDGASSEQFEATYWTCDLTHEYVTINANYRT